MLILDVIKKAYRKVTGDLDYPDADSEDMAVMIDHADDAISEWEDCVSEGYCWPELVTRASMTFAGTGTDALPEDFLNFVRSISAENGFVPAQLKIGGTVYKEKSGALGSMYEQEDATSPYIFWKEGGNIRTYPAASGTITMPYVKQAHRYTASNDATEIEMSNPRFVVDFVTAKKYLENEDDTMYQSYIMQAKDKLDKMKYDLIS